MINLKDLIGELDDFDTNLPKLVEMVYKSVLNINNNGPIDRPVAGAVVINDDGKLLVVYSDFANQGWFCPKGGIDDGETTIDAAKREAYEESGVKVSHLATNEPIIIKTKYKFENTLGFGSPRYEGEGDKISAAASKLLDDAAKNAGINDDVYQKNKIFIFDKLSDVKVIWRGGNPITYHLFAYKGNDTGSSHESTKQEWLTLSEIKNLNGKLHSHLKQIMIVLETGGLLEKIQNISKSL